MPKSQPYENGPCAPSSRTAKDKSNSTTTLTICDKINGVETNGRGSCCSSEKDSGYSDGSDWQQTDAEDQRSIRSQRKVTEKAEAAHKGQNKGSGSRTPENPAMMTAKLVHTPVYIIKDVFNQPPMTQKGSPLLLSNSIICNSSPVIILEQPNLMPASLTLQKPLSRTSSATGKKTNSTYLPIFNSYPRIAPHPSKKPADKSSSNQESQIQNKRMCTEHKTAETPATRNLPEQHYHKQLKLAAQTSVLSCSSSGKHCPSSSSFTITNPSLGSVSSSSVVRGPYRNITTSAHHLRFFNTVELVRQSGLLDITLRTKDLLRQSSTTEQDISQLRQHTELLCWAADNTSPNLSGNTVWEDLYQVMVESGGYPDLKVLQKSQNPSNLHSSSHSSSQPEGISTGGKNRPQAAESSEVSPTCLCTTFTDSQVKQDKKLEACDKIPDKVPFMCPDSSTG